MISLEKHSVNRSFFAFRPGRRSLRNSSFAPTQIPGVSIHVIVSGFSDGGGLHLRISGLQIRKG
jgi:hypothetical protein